MSLNTSSTKALVAFVMSLLGGIGMLTHARMIYGFFGRGLGRWGGPHHHLLWEHNVAGHFGILLPWIGAIAGGIVVVSAIAFYLLPRHRRSLSITILVASLINLFFGMGGMLASFLGIAGSVIALTPATASE